MRWTLTIHNILQIGENQLTWEKWKRVVIHSTRELQYPANMLEFFDIEDCILRWSWCSACSCYLSEFCIISLWSSCSACSCYLPEFCIISLWSSCSACSCYLPEFCIISPWSSCSSCSCCCCSELLSFPSKKTSFTSSNSSNCFLNIQGIMYVSISISDQTDELLNR